MDKVIVKKWLNRGGLVVAIVGIVMVVIAGGDTDSALRTVGIAATIGGEIMRLVREVLG